MGILVPKMRKPRGFNYRPIYWDPDKERREEMVKKAKVDLGMLPKEETFIRSDFHDAFSREVRGHISEEAERRRHGASGFKLIIAIAVLLGLAYVLFFM